MNDRTPTLREWLDSEIEFHQSQMDSITGHDEGSRDTWTMHNISHMHLTRLRQLLPANRRYTDSNTAATEVSDGTN